MSHPHERRREKRIRFSWPLWFGFEQYGQLHQGKIADLSRSGVSFFIREDQSPRVGQHVLTRFTYPCDTSDRFEIESYYHWSEVIRVDDHKVGQCRVAMRLHERLPQEPNQKAAPEYSLQSAQPL
ncbi:MAG: hypothetical protein AMJ79_09090 [Phycisphaerae bacterium SM23_30]|nr:MAG: hypothetical protein AMJ79_09090 [Phycisphaerae bacterium SM23_30]